MRPNRRAPGAGAILEGDELDALQAGVTAGTWRDVVLDEPDSRAANDELLSALRSGCYTAAALARFFARATRRSVRQALHHRRALFESTALHAGLAALADPHHRTWVAGSWLLTISHLGMLEQPDTLGAANTLTLIRANLPALETRLGNTVPVLALALTGSTGGYHVRPVRGPGSGGRQTS